MLKRGLGLKPFLLSSVSLTISKAMFFLGSTIDSCDLRPIIKPQLNFLNL